MLVPPHFMAGHPFDNGDLWVRDELLAGWPRMEEVGQRALADYYALITHMDQEVGRVLWRRSRPAVAPRTRSSYSASDHGLSLGGHGLMGKQNLYDDSMRAPLVIAGPGVPQGSSDALVYLFDLYPTLCELLGVPVPKIRWRGRAWRPSCAERFGGRSRLALHGLPRRPARGARRALEAHSLSATSASRSCSTSRPTRGSSNDLARASRTGRDGSSELTALLRTWQKDLGDRRTRWTEPGRR